MINTTGGQAMIAGQVHTFAVDQDGWPMVACRHCAGNGRINRKGRVTGCYACIRRGRSAWTRFAPELSTAADARLAFIATL